MDWFKKIVEGSQNTVGDKNKNPQNLSAEFLNALENYIALIGESYPKLQNALVGFIIAGTQSECLDSLRNNTDACKKLGYFTGFGSDTKEIKILRKKLVIPDMKVPNEVWIRLGKFFAAANTGFTKLPIPPGWPDWLTNLFAEITGGFYGRYKSEEPPSAWSVSKLEEFVSIAKLPPDALVVAMLDRKYRDVLCSDCFYGSFDYPTAISDLSAYFEKHTDATLEFLKQTDPENRHHILRFLTAINYNGNPSIAELKKIDKDLTESETKFDLENLPKEALVRFAAAQSRLAVRTVSASEAPSHSFSFFGGLPKAPADFEWPHVFNKSGVKETITFVGQINCADIPQQKDNALLPNHGVLYFFLPMVYGTTNLEENEKRVVKYLPQSPGAAWKELPADPHLPIVESGFGFDHTTTFYPKVEVEFEWIDYGPEFDDEDNQWLEIGFSHGDPDCHQMLGRGKDIYGMVQDTSSTHVVLLQILDDKFIGWQCGGGVWIIWITPDDLAARKFDNTVVTLEC